MKKDIMEGMNEDDTSNAMNERTGYRIEELLQKNVENRRDDPEYTDSTCPEKKGPDTVLCRS